MRRLFLGVLSAGLGLGLLLAAPRTAEAQRKAPPNGAYKKVNSLVQLPDFLPGLGTLCADLATLPAGPFLAYDRQGNLVSSIYMIPLKDMNAQKAFTGLKTGQGEQVDHVDVVSSRLSVLQVGLIGTLSKLPCHGIARICHSSRFQYLLQPVEIRRHFFRREFANQRECRASKSPERCLHHFAHCRLARLGARGEMDFPAGSQSR
jgi:hypothetical protein